MSTAVQNIAWETPGLSLAQKMVLVSLADQANDYGESYPGLESIRRRCSMSMRGVYKVLAELEELGLLSREQLPGKNTLYRLHIDQMLQRDLLEEGGVQETPAQARARAAGVQHLHRVQGCTTSRGARGAGVHGVHPAPERKTTPAPGAPIKATKSKATSISSAGAPAALEGSFEGHDDDEHQRRSEPTAAGAIAIELRRRGFRITSTDPNLLAAVAEGVTLDQVAEFAEIYPADHAKCRGSPGYLLSACRRQRAESAEGAESPQGKPHAARQRASSSDRVVEHITRAQRGDDRTLDAEGFRIVG